MNSPESRRTGMIVPAGTQVVTRVDAPVIGRSSIKPVGSVGTIRAAPTDETHGYRIEFVDGGEAMLRRREFAIRAEFTRQGTESPDAPLAEYGLWDCVVYRCVVGSRAYGLHGEDSDEDRRGVYLAPAELHWSLYGAPEQLEDRESDECYWELRKFLVLALKANPNVLECLYTPLVEEATPIGEELRSIRGIFLSKLVYQTYNGYVASQFRKLQQDLRTRGEIRWKHAMHLIRLLISGIGVLQDRDVPVRVDEHREALLAIRSGGTPWEEIERWRLELHATFEKAYAATTLPERPNYDLANAFLVRARRAEAQDSSHGA